MQPIVLVDGTSGSDPPRLADVAARGACCDSGTVLNKLRSKLARTMEELDEDRLQTRYHGLGVTPIAEAPPRTPVRLAGEIQATQVVPRAGSPSLEVTISDGTGRAVAVFTGRRRLGGVDCGRSLVIEGVGRPERGRVLVLNPAYQLVE